MPRVTESNALSTELKRDIEFETKVTSVRPPGTLALILKPETRNPKPEFELETKATSERP